MGKIPDHVQRAERPYSPRIDTAKKCMSRERLAQSLLLKLEFRVLY